jgi:threonine/homoserine/homoserine lactone efflux protein
LPIALILSLLAQGGSLGFAAATGIGPFQTFIISETLARGWRHSLPAVFAPLVSDAPAIILFVLILGQVPAWALRGIQVLGGLFILYLAWGIFKQLRQTTPIVITSTEDTAPKGRNILLRAAAINFFGPGVWIFWSTVNGPIVVKALQESVLAALAFMVAFYGVFIGGLIVFVMIFHQARRLDERVVRTLLAISLVIMLVFAASLLKTGIFG